MLDFTEIYVDFFGILEYNNSRYLKYSRLKIESSFNLLLFSSSQKWLGKGVTMKNKFFSLLLVIAVAFTMTPRLATYAADINPEEEIFSEGVEPGGEPAEEYAPEVAEGQENIDQEIIPDPVLETPEPEPEEATIAEEEGIPEVVEPTEAPAAPEEPLPEEPVNAGQEEQPVAPGEALAIPEAAAPEVAEVQEVEAAQPAEVESIMRATSAASVEADTLAVAAPEITTNSIPERVSSFGYVPQYQYQCRGDNELLRVYVQGANGTFTGEIYFVHRLYDDNPPREGEKYGESMFDYYDPTNAEDTDVLSACETKVINGVIHYLPKIKTGEDGTPLLQQDVNTTGFDDSKVPIITAASLEEDVLSDTSYLWGWRELPFIYSGDYWGDRSYTYATEASGSDANTEVPVNSNVYDVHWSDTLQYDGRAHVWDQITVSKRNVTKQVADLSVTVVRNGEILPPSAYSVSVANNTNVTHYNNNKKYNPYFTVTLKGKAYKKDSSKLAKQKFYFSIQPCSLSSGTLIAKKAVVQNETKVSLTNLYFQFSDGRKVKLSGYNTKKLTGTYSANVLEDGDIRITGYNNFYGQSLLKMSSPKKLTYEW